MTAPFVTRSSHVRVFERCQRRWYFEEIMKHRADDTPAMRFGTAMHAELERWLRDGTPPDVKLQLDGLYPGQAARKSIHLLPTPGKDLMVEHKFCDTKMAPGVEYFGTVDLADPRESAPFHLYDHKSTAGLNFAKTADELQQDVSATFYADRLRWLWGEPEIKARWVYTERARSGKVKPVDFVLTSAMIDDRLSTTKTSVEAMSKAALASSYVDVAPNESACNDYNRKCPHWGKCELTKLVTGVPTSAERAAENMNLLEKAAQNIHPKTETDAPTSAERSAELAAIPGGLSLKEKMALKKKGAVTLERVLETSIKMNDAAATIVSMATQGVFLQPDPETEKEAVDAVLAPSVNPPDAAPPTFEAAPDELTQPKKGKKKKVDPATERVAKAHAAAMASMDGKPCEICETILVKGWCSNCSAPEQKPASVASTSIDPTTVAYTYPAESETAPDDIAAAEALIREAHQLLAANVKTIAQQTALMRLSEAAFWLGRAA